MVDQTRRGAGRGRFALGGLLAGAVLAASMMVVLRHPAAATPVQAARPGVPVTLDQAVRRDVPVFVEGLGQVQASNSVLVRARVDGMLMRFAVTEGQDVKAGDLIAVIDPRPYQAVLDAAVARQAQDQAQLENAKLDLARYASLEKRNDASRQQLDTQRALVARNVALLAGDMAAIESARLNLEFCYIKSPIPGRVGLRLVDPGNLVRATDLTGIVTINQVHPISALFTLPQEDMPRLRAAMAAAGKAGLTVMAIDGTSGAVLDRGTLLTIDNAIDPATGTIRLKADFPNPNGKLWPGQFIEARLQLKTLHDVLTVPEAAVQHGPDGLYAYVAGANDTVMRKPLTVGQQQDGIAVIEKGLSPGERVVVNGQSRLREGVQIVAEAPPGPIPSGVPISQRGAQGTGAQGTGG